MKTSVNKNSESTLHSIVKYWMKMKIHIDASVYTCRTSKRSCLLGRYWSRKAVAKHQFITKQNSNVPCIMHHKWLAYSLGGDWKMTYLCESINRNVFLFCQCILAVYAVSIASVTIIYYVPIFFWRYTYPNLYITCSQIFLSLYGYHWATIEIRIQTL